VLHLGRCADDIGANLYMDATKVLAAAHFSFYQP
jgi:hypothetical protein